MPALGEFIPGTMIDNLPFPSYGSGKVIVRVYTDYFCSPCRAAEPELESLLLELIKSKKITVVFVACSLYSCVSCETGGPIPQHQVSKGDQRGVQQR
jgi:hypothetical protein